jgi:hypothetical protein
MNRPLLLTWAVLIVATLFGFGTAEFLGHPLVAVAAIMVVAGVKVVMVLRSFMELGEGPIAFKVYFGVWVTACVGVITGLYAMGL